MGNTGYNIALSFTRMAKMNKNSGVKGELFLKILSTYLSFGG
jgi:hypothetical protein